MAGSKMKIWKQDPSVTSIGIRTTFIDTPVDDGPKDADIEVKGMPHVMANLERDFLFDQEENPVEFDAVHTFTVVRQVLTMYRRAFNRNGITQNFDWQWGPEPIGVYPRAGMDLNANYSRDARALRFFYFHPGGNELRPLVYTCRSFDIVAHEVGHAVLDSLKPGYWYSSHAETGGLHESFGDLTAIFTMLAQMDQCEAIIAESKGDLHTKTFFPAISEQFGEALGRPNGLRNADNDLRMSDVSTEVHDISRVFTGAIYDILADMFEDYRKPDEYDQAETLFRLGKHITALVILSLLRGPDSNATYEQIATKMIQIEPRAKWKKIIRDEFKQRQILGGPTSLKAAAAKRRKLNWSGCCATLGQKNRLAEIEQAVKAIRKKK